MKRFAALGALLVVALIATFAAQRPGSDAPTPSTTNQGPRGVAVLKTWLSESGIETSSLEGELPSRGEGTLVLIAPSMREFSADEVKTLAHFVETGGTLVYLAPRTAAQPELNLWLGVVGGTIAPLNALDGVEDVGGSTVKVSMPVGPLAGLREFRVSAETGIHVTAPDAIEVADYGALWWRRMGAGQVWLGSGPDLAENARLELADNAQFWLRLPSPVRFEEGHLHAASTAAPVNLLATFLQLAFLAALFVWAFAIRLGPPRDQPATPELSTMHAVRAMAALTQNAKVEGELVQQLKTDFRRFLAERLGIPVAWPWNEAAIEAARRLSVEADEVLRLENENDLLAVSQRIARLERASAPSRH
ncbi:MAG: DUF4350 domain-containing protein [Archangium sp.]